MNAIVLIHVIHMNSIKKYCSFFKVPSFGTLTFYNDQWKNVESIFWRAYNRKSGFVCRQWHGSFFLARRLESGSKLLYIGDMVC